MFLQAELKFYVSLDSIFLRPNTTADNTFGSPATRVHQTLISLITISLEGILNIIPL